MSWIDETKEMSCRSDLLSNILESNLDGINSNITSINTFMKSETLFTADNNLD